MEMDQTVFFRGLKFKEYEFEYRDAKSKCFKGADGGFYRIDHFANNYVIEYAENEAEARSNFFEDSELYGDDVPFDEIVNIIRQELIKMSGVSMRAAIYCRSARPESLDEVIAWGKDYIEKHSEYEVADLYSEYGSGTRINPELNQILELVEQGKYDVIVARDIARITRNSTLFFEIQKRIIKCNAELIIDN